MIAKTESGFEIELDDEAMHLRVVIQALNLAEQTLFGDIILEADE